MSDAEPEAKNDVPDSLTPWRCLASAALPERLAPAAVLGLLAAMSVHTPPAAWAGELSVTVVDVSGQPVPEVAVYATRVDPAHRGADRAESSESPKPVTATQIAALAARQANRKAAVMDQRERAFVPHILVVEAGAVVEFPNSDDFLHHVYSFSSAKPFELPLYGRLDRPSLAFDEPGLVTLGCNIHDAMLGYILVVDTPYSSITDRSGQAILSGLPAGTYQVAAWTPRLHQKRLPAATSLSVAPDAASELTVRFDSKLRPPHRHSSTSLLWDDY